MSYQLLSDKTDDAEESDWLDGKDKLLMTLPMLGTVFTKVYYDPIENRPQVDLCLPDEVIINQKAKSLRKAQRVTHIIWLTTNEIKTRQKMGLFLDMPIKDLVSTGTGEGGDDVQDPNVSKDSQRPGEDIIETDLNSGVKLHKFQEQCTYLDLDGDGYSEPYTVTVHEATQKVVRIVARYNFSSFVLNKAQTDWVKIKPDVYYIVYRFLPSFDNTFYGMGFCQMLYPLNAAANSTLNRLLDAGTLSNMQSGFIGKGVRMRKQTMRLRPGEWVTVSTATGVDLSRNIVPIPTKEPSTVLFELLQMLVKSAQEVSGVSDVMQGQLPPANTPATTVVNVISEGSKVYSAIRIRLDNSLRREYSRLFELNKEYLDDNTSFKTAEGSGQISKADYAADSYGILTVANATLGTKAQELAAMQGLLSLIGDPLINKQEVYRRYFSALNLPDPDKLFAPPPPPNAPPPPEVQKTLEEIDLIKMKIADVATDIEKKGIELDLREKELLINAENIGSLAAERKVNSIVAIEEVRQTENQQQIDATKNEVDKMVEESTPEMDDVEPQIQQFSEEAQQASGLQPPAPTPPPGGEGAPGLPGGEGGLQQSLADKMEQTAPQPQQPQGGENLPLGEPK
jgi:hypothetical protein